jgi:hypothetical protein
MKLKLLPSSPIIDNANELATNGSVPIPFFPHRRVSRTTALAAITLGIWPVLIAKIFSAGARDRKLAKLANSPRRN